MIKNILIIEDETAAAVNLQTMLRNIDPNFNVLAVLESIEESVEYLSDNQQSAPDIIFMDIHLADGESFRIFDKVQVTSPIVFTTAYDEYALQAFQVNSIDYLLKPIKQEDLTRALNKLSQLSNSARVELSERINKVAEQQPEGREQVFLIHHKDRIVPLNIDEIAYFYTSNEKVTATTFDGVSYTIDRTLEMLQSTLPGNQFFRANRQFIVARRAVKDIVVWFGNRLSLNLTVAIPEKIIISKARVPEFKQWLTVVQL